MDLIRFNSPKGSYLIKRKKIVYIGGKYVSVSIPLREGTLSNNNIIDGLLLDFNIVSIPLREGTLSNK